MNAPLIVERVVNAPVKKVWQAITDKDQMKQWYFDLPDFSPDAGTEFRFWGGTPEKQYLHICVVKEVIKEKKISYSWRYDGYKGDSLVTFELFEEGEQTRVKLTHDLIESFGDIPDFARSNFEGGWNELIGNLLPGFVEK